MSNITARMPNSKTTLYVIHGYMIFILNINELPKYMNVEYVMIGNITTSK